MDLRAPNPTHEQSQPDTLWTTINSAEQIPGVLSPLGFTFWLYPCDRSVKAAFSALGVLPRSEVRFGATPDERAGGAFFGRWAVNVDVFRRLADMTPGTSGAAFEEQMFGSVRPDVPVVTARHRYPVVALKAPAAVLRLPWSLPALAAETKAWWRDVTSPAGQARPPLPQLREALVRTEQTSTVQMLGALAGQGLFDKLGALAAQAGLPELHLRLASGYGGMEETRMVSALYAVAQGRSTVEDFLAGYGARGPSEVDISVPSWRENPKAVHRLVEKYRSAPSKTDPELESRGRAGDRVEAERTLLAALPAVHRPGARLVFRMARTFIPLREEGKAMMVTAMDGGRCAARGRGRELVQAGAIREVEDVFYLTLDEVLDGPPRDAADLVAHRRALRAEYEKVNVPTLWTGTPEPVLPEPVTEERVSEVSGIGAAFGTVEGRAHVITDADRADELEPDEVLVCHTTDPSWASAFHLAAAVVINIGGINSHGPIVCREMGLPCVINTGNGTTLLRTGDLLRVDGAAGVVTVLAPAAEQLDTTDDNAERKSS